MAARISAPSELRRGHRRAFAFGHRHPVFGAGIEVDVRPHGPGLGDQAQLGQLVEQLARDLGALADQYQHLGVAQPHRELAHALDGVGEHLGRVGFELGGAGQLAHGVLVVVEDHDVHGGYCARLARRLRLQ